MNLHILDIPYKWNSICGPLQLDSFIYAFNIHLAIVLSLLYSRLLLNRI